MSEATDKSDAAWRPKANPWLIAVVVTMAAFMEILDTTIVNVSLPHIAGSVSASYDDATWALTSYLVANGIVLPISGFLGRVIGRKRYFLICIAMFTVSSFLCGTSTSLGELIVFRLMQGFFRRRTAAEPAIDHSGHVRAGPARQGVRRGGDRRHLRPGDRPDLGRLDHRQLLVALDFLHQHPGRHLRLLRRHRAGGGSALGVAHENQHPRIRLSRAGIHRAGAWQLTDYAGPR